MVLKDPYLLLEITDAVLSVEYGSRSLRLVFGITNWSNEGIIIKNCLGYCVLASIATIVTNAYNTSVLEADE
jgi:hypothetical protein